MKSKFIKSRLPQTSHRIAVTAVEIIITLRGDVKGCGIESSDG